jgi:metal-sulfur cluster biosynthetic enzyme
MTSEEEVLESLRNVIDPEMGVNIVDLGLVYHIEVNEDRVRVSMTMTSPVCPLGPYLMEKAEAVIRGRMPGIQAVEVHLIWDPPWSPDRMSSQAKHQLGWESGST